MEVVERLSDEPVDLLEINVSCPNVKAGGIAFGQNPDALDEITKAIKAKAKQPIVMKLSPNVTDITEMAKAAEAGGSDALSMINTITGMRIDIHRRQFILANQTGGMSGPAIKPVALRMVSRGWPRQSRCLSSVWAAFPRRRMPWNSFWQVPQRCLWERPISQTRRLR